LYLEARASLIETKNPMITHGQALKTSPPQAVNTDDVLIAKLFS
jgi:hypothetical protein